MSIFVRKISYTQIRAALITLLFALSMVIPLSVDAQEKNLQKARGVITLSADDYEEDVSITQALSWLTITPQLTFDYSSPSEVENTRYCGLLDLCALTHTFRDAQHVRGTTGIQIDAAAIESFTHDLARRVNRAPANATFRMRNGSVVTSVPHKNGLTLDVEKSRDAIIAGLHKYAKNDQNHITLTYHTTPAEITAKNIADLGIREFIGEGRSDFAGSSHDRIHNIRTAAARFDGLIFGPGEEFSFVEHLGPVDGEHGYKEELVIKDNQTKPEFGGGICQVSTTVFRGAILTGMEITARRNHSYPVKYYEPVGFDATIYLPAPDMRFKNNTPGHILLQTEIEGSELVFRYFGTQDGRKVVMDGPHITEKNDDGSMKTYFTQTVKDKNGGVIIDDTFGSNYKSPKDYPKPGDVSDTTLTEKPRDWSKKEWEKYVKKQNA